jgi:teichuronic acid biosynthesis glycosyltransferase TuaC
VKVLTYTSLFPNPAQPELGVFIYQRMTHFAALGNNEVVVVAPIPYAPSWFSRTRWRKWTGIPPVEKRGNLTVYHPAYAMLPGVSLSLQGLLMFLGSFPLVRRIHQEHRFDIVDAHFVYPDGLAAILLGRMLHLPTVVSARGTDINMYPSLRLIRPQIRWTLKNAAGAIAVCKPLGDEMRSLVGPVRDVAVIGNGVDPTRFFPVDREEARKQLGLPLDSRIAIAVGSLIPRKGYQFLIPAVAKIRKQFPDLHLYIVGEGDHRSELERMIQALDLVGCVDLRGNCPNTQLRAWYSAADISCLVSSREGWPNVLLESMACGTPAVATGVWGTPEVITSQDLGVIVEQNVDSIAAGLESALRRTWAREHIAAYARSRDWNVVAREVQEYLGTILRRQALTAEV